MAAYVSVNPSSNPNTGAWFGADAWFNTTAFSFGQPGAGDAAVILDTDPTVSSGYIDGPTIWLSTGTDSGLGLTGTNTVFGGDSNIYITGGTTSQPQINLNNALIYGNIYDQQGNATINVGGSDYGASFGTMVIGGLTGPNASFEPASLNINAYGTWSNIGNMYVFADGSSQISSSQPISNYGAMAANDGTLLISENSAQGAFTNHGQIYAANTGTVTTDGTMAQDGGVTVNGGTFVLGGAANGTGTFNLVSGTMEFMQAFAGTPLASTFASTLTTEFTGNSFSLAFPSTFSSLSATVSGHTLAITGSYEGQAATLSLTLDTAHTYSSSQFTASPADSNGLTHVTYTA